MLDINNSHTDTTNTNLNVAINLGIKATIDHKKRISLNLLIAIMSFGIICTNTNYYD